MEVSESRMERVNRDGMRTNVLKYNICDCVQRGKITEICLAFNCDVFQEEEGSIIRVECFGFEQECLLLKLMLCMTYFHHKCKFVSLFPRDFQVNIL